MPAPAPDRTPETIRVRGARTHNLKNIDLEIPRDRLVVITGVSGSGKSSLAFDTLFAEGERRYLDSLSAHGRQELQTVARPDVDEIDGLPPTLAVAQRGGQVSPRSTLGTLTEIHDFLRVLYARVGIPHCPNCGRVIRTQPVDAIVDRIVSLEAGRKVMLLAPVIHNRKGAHKDVFEQIVRDGFVRARVDGEIIDAAAPPTLKKTQTHTIEAVIDRIVVKDGLRPRLLESVHLALRLGDGSCTVSVQEGTGWRDELYSSRFACPDCGLSYLPIEPGTFSFNTAAGACPRCEGLGTVAPETSAPKGSSRKGQSFKKDLPRPKDSAPPCPECKGTRLSPLARAVRWAGRGIHELSAQTVGQVAKTLSDVAVPPADQPVVERLLPEIEKRLAFLNRVGLHYLTLDRGAGTLSGGELQRARLARSLGTGLIGMCYILDEPTQGLHPRDTTRLIHSLQELRDQGNSVLVVEHDLDVMHSADWLIDIGPGAGEQGGTVVASGPPADIARTSSSTARFLRADSPDEHWQAPPRAVAPDFLTVSGASSRNLKNVTAGFLHGGITCVTGVSGSGKTTLLMETVVPLVRRTLQDRPGSDPESKNPSAPEITEPAPESTAKLSGADLLSRLIVVDQSPLGRSGRSNPATASGVWDHVRRIFARTKDARLRGYGPRRFSFNETSGRCAACRGTGTLRLAVATLAGLQTPCPECRGARFNRQTLQVRFKGLNVADVLGLRIDDARELFQAIEPIRRILSMFVEVGLGYLTLGQPAPTLSGGEAQRIKLAAELGEASEFSGGRTLYVLDEPTSGLHPADVERLLLLLRRLANAGHTVIVIEHHLPLIAAADWVVDLGPDAGEAGGTVVAQGPPPVIVRNLSSLTGRALGAGKAVPP